MLEDSFTECMIEDRYFKTDYDPDETVFDGDNVQLNVGTRSYGEKSITDDSDNVNKNCDQEITKTREILEKAKIMMKESS